MMRATVALSFALLTACQWDAPTPHLEGTWRFRFDDMTDGHVQCGVQAMDVIITQTGSSFSGIQTGSATRHCVTEVGAPVLVTFADDTLSGAIGRLGIAFTFVRTPGAGAAWSQNSHSGSVSGNVMLGRATWTGSSSARELTGTFAAFRLPE